MWSAETNEKCGRHIHRRNGTPARTKETKRTFSKDDSALCLPDPTDGLGDAHVVCLELVQTDRGGQGESAEEPVAHSVELGHTPRAEVVNYGGPDEMSE